MKKLLSLIMVILCLSVAGCGNNHSKQILGIWDSAKTYTNWNYTYSFEFYEDNSVFLYLERDGGKRSMNYSGEWTLLENNKLKIVTRDMGTELYDISFEDGNMILSGDSFAGTYIKQ